MVATFFCAEQLQLLAQSIQQSGSCIDLKLVRRAIHAQADWPCDYASSLWLCGSVTVLYVGKNSDCPSGGRHLQEFTAIEFCLGHCALQVCCDAMNVQAEVYINGVAAHHSYCEKYAGRDDSARRRAEVK